MMDGTYVNKEVDVMSTPRTGTAALAVRELRSGWIVLYAMTLALQVLCAAARFIVAFPAMLIFNKITGWHLPADTIAMVIAFAPLILSIATLVYPLDGWWWQLSIGGRSPVEEERITFDEAMSELRAADPNIRAPRHWFVAEDDSTNACAYGASLCIDRGLFRTSYLTCTIAHELGHLKTSDARLTSALNLLLVSPTDPPLEGRLRSLPFRWWLWMASGEAGLWLMRIPWGMYWRSREFAADEYAARLGQGTGLADSLRHEALPNEQPVRWMRFSGRASHPYTTQRITALHAYKKK
jgi:Zn-dependent protease with chaperone function